MFFAISKFHEFGMCEESVLVIVRPTIPEHFIIIEVKQAGLFSKHSYDFID